MKLGLGQLNELTEDESGCRLVPSTVTASALEQAGLPGLCIFLLTCLQT